MTDRETGNATERPHEGGSYVVGPDGKLVREEFTRQKGEAGHSPASPPAVTPPPAKRRGKE